MALETIVQTILATSGGGLVYALGRWFGRRKDKADVDKTDAETGKTDAEAMEILTRASASMIEPLERQIGRLSGQLDAAETKVSELLADLQHAQDLLRANGITWVPRIES